MPLLRAAARALSTHAKVSTVGGRRAHTAPHAATQVTYSCSPQTLIHAKHVVPVSEPGAGRLSVLDGHSVAIDDAGERAVRVSVSSNTTHAYVRNHTPRTGMIVEILPTADAKAKYK